MTPGSSDAIDAGPEQQRWQADLRLRERELDIKERAAAQETAQKAREFDAKLSDQRWARWTNPLVLAVFAAALAAFGNTWLAYVNSAAQRELELTRSNEQIKLEREKADIQKNLEEAKAETSRILEVIKTADPEKAAANLEFLLKAGLITDTGRKKSLEDFLTKRRPGEGPSIPPAGAAVSFNHPSYNLPLPADNPLQTRAATRLLGVAVAEINRNVDEQTAVERIEQYWRATNAPLADVRILPWSAAFLSWSIRETGNNDRLPMSTTNIAIWNDAVRKKLTFLPNEKPVLPGDVVMLTSSSAGVSINDIRAGRIDHAPTISGIVYSVAPEKFSIIQGNTGNAIRLRDLTLSIYGLVGFIRLSDTLQ